MTPEQKEAIIKDLMLAGYGNVERVQKLAALDRSIAAIRALAASQPAPAIEPDAAVKAFTDALKESRVFAVLEGMVLKLGGLVESQPAPAADTGQAVAYMHPIGAIWRLDNCPADIDFTKDGWIPLGRLDHPAPLDADRVREAFEAGAMAVHREWLRAHEAGEGPPRGDPEFGEAASDYAHAAQRQKEGK